VKAPVRTQVPVGVFFALFTVSGFAGLIYESIWSHYLKLFLGHAAYAQTLVLAIFMGGMAIGSWLVSRSTGRIRNLLLGYAAAELGIGLLALVFHPTFVAIVDWAYVSVLPGMASPTAINLFKWTLASLLILPASILLGTTFPLMSAGIIRLYPDEGPRALAMLYFTNCLGASIGVLASGFVLVDRVGLPGTMLTGGLFNIALAIAVWTLSKRIDIAPPQPETRPADTPVLRWQYRALLVAACITGAASFIYEIAWIRLLSLGMGSSSHAFEVMLSAFILGIALGGFAVRKAVGRMSMHPAWLVVLFLAKGLLAVIALRVYVESLDMLQWTLKGIAPSSAGYTLFTLLGYAFSALVMLPTAFVAGMALPLLTQALIGKGWGERSIGAIYSANTAGCILGAFFATHFGMELLGTKGLTAAGAFLDAGGAVLILAVGWDRAPLRRFAAPLAVFFVLGAGVYWSAHFDPHKLVSGIYRTGTFLDASDHSVDFLRDGKTATIAFVRRGSFATISTNGKPDASVELSATARPAVDEPTMIIAGALPLAFKPGAKDVANIGFGSGLTTHTVLASPAVERVDSVEIERQMIEGARLFGERNARAYTDPRSRIVLEDAKTFFASNGRKYDVIISEPSNPWVSGVSTLFSDEFYSRTRTYLKDDGVLVQWLQLYEINLDLVGSMFKALSRNFGDYAVYGAGHADVVIVATKASRLPPLEAGIFAMPQMARDLERIGVRSIDDLRMLRVGSKRSLDPLFGATRYPSNSDYFPVVDQNAARSRFMKESSMELWELGRDFVPLVELIDGEARATAAQLDYGSHAAVSPVMRAKAAQQRLAMLAGDSSARGLAPRDLAAWHYLAGRSALTDCEVMTPAWVELAEEGLRNAASVLPREAVRSFVSRVVASPCLDRLPPEDRTRLNFSLAVAARDYPAMARFADELLASGRAWGSRETATFLAAGMTAHLAQNHPEAARAAWERHGSRVPPADRPFILRLAAAHALQPRGAGQ
jgi:predicted membrane-bound spermidine synthase